MLTNFVGRNADVCSTLEFLKSRSKQRVKQKFPNSKKVYIAETEDFMHQSIDGRIKFQSLTMETHISKC